MAVGDPGQVPRRAGSGADRRLGRHRQWGPRSPGQPGELERELGELFAAVLEVLGSEVGDRAEIRRLLSRDVRFPGPPGPEPDGHRRQRLLPEDGGPQPHRGRAGQHRPLPGLQPLLPVHRRVGPHHVRRLRLGPGGDHPRPGRAAPRAVDPGREAVGRGRGGAAGRHSRQRPHAGGDGEPAPGSGRHRQRARHRRHHRCPGGRHPGRPASPPHRDGRPPDGRRVHRVGNPAPDRADDRGVGDRIRWYRHQSDARRRAGGRVAAEGRRARRARTA